MAGAYSSPGEHCIDKSNVLSFGCELEFIVAYLEGDEPDPDADSEGLAPILRVPVVPEPCGPDSEYAGPAEAYIFNHITDTLRQAGFTAKKDCSWPPPHDIPAERARAMFGIAVKSDSTVNEGAQVEGWNGYHFQGVELNTSASWTSPIAFQELELVIQVLLHSYRIRVNRNCGLHFHVGIGPKPLNTQTVKRIAALLWCLDPIMCHVHPPQRRRMPHSVPIRENSAFACSKQTSLAVSNDTFFEDGIIGKPKLGASVRMAPARPARTRRFPSSRLPTFRADPDTHAKLEKDYPDGFDGYGLMDIAEKVVDSALDGVWRFLSCSNTAELAELMQVAGGGIKSNYSFTGYIEDQNVDGQDEWRCEMPPDRKLTIEFREATGSLDAEWISAWGRICAGIVLFAQNASTTDFFGMLMRLGHAQGDFGDPGPAPYDFLDFLDDIGCFAEAEVIEAKLQDKELFWYPCRKLVHAAADPEEPGDGWGAQESWIIPSPPKQDFWTPPSTPPAREPSSFSWPWGGKPPKPVCQGTGKEENTTETGRDGLADSIHAESGVSEAYSEPGPGEDVPTAADEMEDKAGSHKPSSTAAPKPEFAGFQPTNTTAPDQGSTTNGEKQVAAPEDEDATNTAPEHSINAIETEPEPEPDIDMVSQDTEKPSDERVAAEREAARVAASEQGAREAYTMRFPNGYETIDVSGAGLLCGPRALIESIIAQEPSLLYPPPTVKELQDLLDAADIPYVDDNGDLTLEKNRDNYKADQLAVMLQAWGQELHPDLVLRLGLVRPGKAPFLYPVEDSHRATIIIWVWNNDAQDEQLGIYGHYQGLRPSGPPILVGNPNPNAVAATGGGHAEEDEEEEEL